MKALITGASGMVGSLVLNQLINDNSITEIITIGRKYLGIKNPKVKELELTNLKDYSVIEQEFLNVDKAFFCIGAYTGTVSDSTFKTITVDFTKAFADTLKKQSPNALLCFLSGQGADQTEKSKVSFAKYKGMAENYLISKNFKGLFLFRPSYIYPVTPRKEPNFAYKAFRFLYPVIRLFGKNYSIKSTELAASMVHVAKNGSSKTILENRDILEVLG